MSLQIATPDVYDWPIPVTVASVTCRESLISVQWTDGQTSRFHPMWLRDQCACEDCTSPVNFEQTLDLLEIPENIAPKEVSLRQDGAICVTWNVGDHRSVYHPGWLFAHSGLAVSEEVAPELWVAADLPMPPEFNAEELDANPNLMLELCNTVCRSGLALVHGLPTETGTVEQFALRFGPVRESHFERVFNVVSRPDSDSKAYTSEELPAHTDMPTRETPHGLQMLHCIQNMAQGGEAVMIDGFRIAEDLRAEAPEVFHNLSTQKWPYANRAGQTDYRFAAPHFELNEDGSLKSIRLASFSRAPLIADVDAVEEAYSALRRFLAMTYDDRYRMTFNYQPGDLVIFDNRRILHAREAFDPASGERHLQGTYIDRDDFLSTRRMCLHRQHSTQMLNG